MAEVSELISWNEHDYMDITRARAELGYQPKYDLLAGMADYIGWLRAENLADKNHGNETRNDWEAAYAQDGGGYAG
jgi:hypothetical protein